MSWLLIAVITLGALFLRLNQIDRLGLSYEEATFAMAATHADRNESVSIALNPDYQLPIPRDVRPFASVLAPMLHLAKDSDIAVRILSAFATTGAVLVAYLFASIIIGRPAALVFALLVATSPALVAAGRTGTPDGLSVGLLLALGLSAGSLLRRLHPEGVAVAAASLVAIHFWTPDAVPAAETILIVFLLARVAPIVLLGIRSRRHPNARSEVIHGLISAMGATGALIAISNLAQVGPLGIDGGRIGASSGGLLAGVPPGLTALSAILGELTLPIALFSAIGLAVAAYRPSRQGFFVCLWMVGGAIQLWMTPAPQNTLYLIWLVPFMLLAAHGIVKAWGLVAVRTYLLSNQLEIPSIVSAAAAVLVMSTVLAYPLTQAVNHVQYDDYGAGIREAALWIKANSPADAGVLTTVGARLPVRWYVSQPVYDVFSDPQRLRQLIVDGQVGYVLLEDYTSDAQERALLAAVLAFSSIPNNSEVTVGTRLVLEPTPNVRVLQFVVDRPPSESLVTPSNTPAKPANPDPTGLEL